MLNSKDSDLTGIELVRQAWPEDGRFTAERAVEVASAIAELWSYLRAALTGNDLLADCSTSAALLSSLATANSRAWDVVDGLCLDIGSAADPLAVDEIKCRLDSAAYALAVAREDLSHAAGWVAHAQKQAS